MSPKFDKRRFPPKISYLVLRLILSNVVIHKLNTYIIILGTRSKQAFPTSHLQLGPIFASLLLRKKPAITKQSL